MTYIQFYGGISIESVCACLASPPEKLIIIGSDSKAMRRYARAVAAMLHRRGTLIATEVRNVPENDLQAVYTLLCDLMNAEGKCSVCLNGGDEPSLVATGMIYEKYSTVPKLHRFDLNNGSVIDLHKDGREERFEAPAIRVDEMVALFGGKVVYENEKPDGTRIWNISDELITDAETAWNICKVNPKTWNNLISALGVLLKYREETDGPACTMKADEYERAMHRENGRAFYSDQIMRRLLKVGLIERYSRGDKFSVKFKNEQIMHILTVAGLALELKVYFAALKASDNGVKTYDDVLQGVFVDWDGVVTKNGTTVDTENEIDIMMVRGGIPVFVSCKNGYFDSNELYKLSIVAERFGGRYAKKAIVASSLSQLGKAGQYIRERADDMGITIIDDVRTSTDEELVRQISALWTS